MRILAVRRGFDYRVSRLRIWSRLLLLCLAAVVCAAVSNLSASRERKLAWMGSYPEALRVPIRVSATGAQEASAPPTPIPTSLGEPVDGPDARAARDIPLQTPLPAAKSPVPNPTRIAATTPAPPEAAPPATAEKSFPPHPDRAAIEITPQDVEELHRRKALFLDARRTSVYTAGHIAGARSFPVWESDIDERVKAFYEEGRDQNAPVVVYCSGGDCEDSHMLAQKLYFYGFNNVLIYKDGFPDWQKRGRPVTRGANP